MPVAGQDGVDELLMIAWRFEEKIFQAATDQQDYLRKISQKMLSLDTKANGNPLQARHNVPVPQAAAQAAIKPVDAASVESSAHSGPTPALGSADQRDIVWTKLQLLKDKYLQDMNELYGMLSTRSNQPMPAEQLQKLKHYKDVLHRMIPYLRVPKERVPKEFNQDKVDAFEKQIVNIMETFKKRRQTQATGPPGPAAPGQPPTPAGAPQPAPAQHPDQLNHPQSGAISQAEHQQQQQQPQMQQQQHQQHQQQQQREQQHQHHQHQQPDPHQHQHQHQHQQQQQHLYYGT